MIIRKRILDFSFKYIIIVFLSQSLEMTLSSPMLAAEISQNNNANIQTETNNTLTKGELRVIIKKRYKSARVKDVDIEIYNGQRVYDVDFIFQGKPYEAFVTRNGHILKVQIDPNVDDGD